MNVDLHLSRLSSFGFTHLLGLVAPLSGRHTEIYKYGKHKLRYPLFYFAWGGMHMRRRFVVLIDAAGPRLVRLNYYNQMSERCPRTQTDK